MDESKILSILDMLSDRAKEFVLVSDDVLTGERALQSRDGENPIEWQVCSVLSAFINYLGESERLRYGHFAFDLERKNNEHKKRPAIATLGRMKMFWEHLDDAELSEDQIEMRDDLITRFIANDSEIRKHLRSQPNMYEDGVDQEQHRDWSLRLRLLGEKEALLMKEWERLLRDQHEKTVPAEPQP